MQSYLIVKLKQSLAEKEYNNRFNQLLQPTLKINREERFIVEPILPSNPKLPSISNTKLALSGRNKSASAKKIPTKNQLEKAKNTKSTKKILNQRSETQELSSNKRHDFDDLIVKKQSVGEGSNSKMTAIRTKLFSLRTPSREGQRLKEGTYTKDVTAKQGSTSKLDRGKAVTIRQFNAKIQQLNEQMLLSLKGGKIDSQNLQNKKIMALMSQLKSNRSEEYLKLQRTIDKFIKFTQKYRIKDVIIEFKSLLQLASKKVLSNYQIVDSFLRKEDIIANYKIPGLQYYTTPQQKGQNVAAQRITSFFKMIFSKKFYKNLSGLLKKVKVIQKYWRTCLLTRKTRRQILANTEGKLKKHAKLQKAFCSDWNIIKTSQRFQIHICSYSLQQFKRLTTKNLKQKQNNQLIRIFRAQETDVSVIYVLPFQLKEEIMKYYQSIFSFNPTNPSHKVYFVVPQNRARIEQAHCSITTVAALLYSPKALKRIKQIINKQHAYIVPSFPSIEYANLSAELNIPVFSSNQNLMKLYSTKSGAKKILQSIGKKQKAPFLIPKSVLSVFSEKELINALSILIYRHKQIKVWYLKIEDEIHSRGLAYLNILKIAFLRQLCSGSSEFQGFEESELIKLIAEQMSAKLRHRLKIINKDVYSDYDQYISHFLTRGGVVEAGVPGDRQMQVSVSLLIQPSGEFCMVGTYNKLQLGSKSINQAIRSPSQLSNIDYEGITRNLYKELYLKQKLFGYFTCDFIYSHTTDSLYAIGLDCFLNEKTASLSMISFCCDCRYDKDSNSLLNRKEQSVHYTYCPSLTLLQMPSMPSFFKNCKFQNIYFDLQQRKGTIFILLDQLQSQQIGFVTIQWSQIELFSKIKTMVQYFCRQYRSTKSSHDEVGLLKGAVTTALRQLQKQSGPKKLANKIQYIF